MKEELIAEVYAGDELIGDLDITVHVEDGVIKKISLGNVTLEGDIAQALAQEFLFRTDPASLGH